MSTDSDLQNTTINPKVRKGKSYYISLIGHPLFGRKVLVIQCGRTDTQHWCLVTDPDTPEFRYRLNQRWLDSEPPIPPQLIDPQKLHLPLTYEALVRLTRFLQEKIKSMEALKDPPKPLFSEKDTLQTYCKKQEQRIQNDPRSKNLGSHSSEKKTNVNLETEECAVLAMSKGDGK